jgi:hypothetical protein
MDKQYLVFGGYDTNDFSTIDYSEAFEDFLKRVKLTKPLTDARIGMVSAWVEDGKLKIETNALVIMPGEKTLSVLNSFEKMKDKAEELTKDESKTASECLEEMDSLFKEFKDRIYMSCLDNSPEYYKLKYE